MSRRFRELLAKYDLTPSQWGILCSLWKQDGQPTLQLGRQIDLLPGTLTGVIRNLEQHGWVTRSKDETDARVARIWLTSKGKRLERRVVPAVSTLMQSYFSKFSDKDIQLLSTLIDQLRTALDAGEQDA